MNYLEELNRGMTLLAENNALFVGQAMKFPGHGITHQVKNFPTDQLVEFPVAEELQMGYCLGRAIAEDRPIVSVYPRWNFLLLALNQLVNHVDKWEEMGGTCPHMITYVTVGSAEPLNPGLQHKSSWATETESMCDNLKVMELLYPYQVLPAFKKASENPGIYLIAAHADLY